MHRRTAGSPDMADFHVGDRVMTVEGYPGTVTDVFDYTPAMTTYWVDLDDNQGGGEWGNGELTPLSPAKSAALGIVDPEDDPAEVESSLLAATDYPELGDVVANEPPIRHRKRLSSQADYDKGYHDALTIPAREPADPYDAEAMSDYAMGWADGIGGTGPNQFPSMKDLVNDQVGDLPRDFSVPQTTNIFAAAVHPNEEYGGKYPGLPDGTDFATHAEPWGDEHLYSYDWCFAGETMFLTSEGERSFKEVAGSTQFVLDGRGDWVQAEIKSFGVQPLRKITLKKGRATKVIYATGEHRWLVETKQGRQEITTDLLVPKQRLAYRLPRKLMHQWSVSPFGVAHGITFGDGTLTGSGDGLRGKAARLPLWGEKDAQLLKYFVGSSQTSAMGYLNQNATGMVVKGLPRFFKDRPSLGETPDYLLGWLAGYFAADGRVGKRGNITLYCADRDTLVFVQAVCARLGIGTYDIATSSRLSCAGKGLIHDYRVSKYGECSWDTVRTDIHCIGFVPATLESRFFLIQEHRDRFDQILAKVTNPDRKGIDGISWYVSSVEETDREEEVFCAVVSTTHSFVLQSNILTGNCRYRNNSHCFYSKNLDVKASTEAGYAVWIPEDRGPCWRVSWPLQESCPVAQPGPNVPGGFTDATVPYDQGGQHGGSPTNTYRAQ